MNAETLGPRPANAANRRTEERQKLEVRDELAEKVDEAELLPLKLSAVSGLDART